MRPAIKISRSADGSFRACCPSLPGCTVCARSRQEAEKKINQAVVGYLASLNVALPRELARLADLSW